MHTPPQSAASIQRLARDSSCGTIDQRTGRNTNEQWCFRNLPYNMLLYLDLDGLSAPKMQIQ